MLEKSPLAYFRVYARLEGTTAPPNRGHDAHSAHSYNCDSVRPSVFNCEWKPYPPPTPTPDFHSHPLQTDTK